MPTVILKLFAGKDAGRTDKVTTFPIGGIMKIINSSLSECSEIL